MSWTEQVLREYVIPKLKPDIILNWLTEPDHTEHNFGTGSNQVLDALKNDDRNIGLVLQKLRKEGLYGETDIFVVSDHGFSWNTYTVNLKRHLVDAGLKKIPNPMMWFWQAVGNLYCYMLNNGTKI